MSEINNIPKEKNYNIIEISTYIGEKNSYQEDIFIIIHHKQNKNATNKKIK